MGKPKFFEQVESIEEGNVVRGRVFDEGGLAGHTRIPIGKVLKTIFRFTVIGEFIRAVADGKITKGEARAIVRAAADDVVARFNESIEEGE